MGPYAFAPRLVIPTVYRLPLIELYHDSPFGGHLGITRTFRKIANRYYWPTLWQDIVDYIKQCPACQQDKVRRRSPGLAQTKIEAPTRPFEIVSVDFVGPLEQSADFKYILTMIDMFTHWAIAVPTENMEAITVGNLIIDQLYTKHGAPRILVSDRGSNFISHVLDSVYKHQIGRASCRERV